MENTIEFDLNVVTSQIQPLLYFLSQYGSSPSWVYWNRKTLKFLTKEGYITFDRKTHCIDITVKGESWIKEHPRNKPIDMITWMRDKSFCRLQRLISQKKCYKLIDHLANTNRFHLLHDLFIKIRENKHKIWKNRIVRYKQAFQRFGVDKHTFLVLEIEALGPYQLRAKLLDLYVNQVSIVDDLPRFEALQYISSAKAECLRVLAKS